MKCKILGLLILWLLGMNAWGQDEVRNPVVALKTNMLFDVAAAPNVEAEFPVGNNWSVLGEIMCPWWMAKDKQWCYQVLNGGVEGRYWFRKPYVGQVRRSLLGHFMGLYANTGMFDLRWKGEGYQDDWAFAAGISYGYAHRLNETLSMEYSIGVGYLRSNCFHYKQDGDVFRGIGDRHLQWYGPTKLKVSLVWTLCKKGGGR